MVHDSLLDTQAPVVPQCLCAHCSPSAKLSPYLSGELLSILKTQCKGHLLLESFSDIRWSQVPAGAHWDHIYHLLLPQHLLALLALSVG